MKVRAFVIFVISAVLLAAQGVVAYAAENIETWSYANSPPYVIDQAKEKGLSFDTIAYLNKKLAGQFVLKLSILPKVRVDQNIKKNAPGILLWAVSLAYGGIEGGLYDWSAPIIKDQQEFLSLKSKPVEYTGKAESLFKVRLGGIIGHKYFGIQDEIDRGQIVREDVSQDQQNIDKLTAGRIDVTTIANSIAKYYIKTLGLERDAHFSKIPLNTYSRHILLQKGTYPALKKELEKIIASMNSDPEWKSIMAKHGL